MKKIFRSSTSFLSVFFAISLFLSAPVIAFENNTALPLKKINYIKSGHYFETALDLIRNSQKNIFLLMPEVRFDILNKNSEVTKLMQELVKAKRRGVGVFVLLNVDHARMMSGRLSKNLTNRDAFFFLNDNGVAVHFDDTKEPLTTKFMVVDDQFVLTGSSFWIDEVLKSEYQIDYLIESSEYAIFLKQRLKNIRVVDNPIGLEYYDQLYLPTKMIKHPNGLRAFYLRQDVHSLNLYLHLLKLYYQEQQPATLVLNTKDLIDVLHLDKSLRKGSREDRVKLFLDKLQELYVLIEYRPLNFDGDIGISFFDPDSAEKLELPFCEGIRISNSFLEGEWYKSLSINAYYVYFSLLALESQTGYGTWFWVGHDLGGGRPSDISHNKYLEAMRELREHNLITVEYIGQKDKVDFAYLDFYCVMMRPQFEEWYKEKLDELQKEYSPRKVKQALMIAEAYLKERDIDFIEQIINDILIYPSNTVNETFVKRIKPMEHENPFKTLPKFVEALKELSEVESE